MTHLVLSAPDKSTFFSLRDCHPRRGSRDIILKDTGCPVGMTEVFSKTKLSSKQSGFSLIEMAIVLVILGFILGGVVGGLSAQRDVQRSNDTKKQLDEIRNALIGFVQINNRLPCPASLTSQGRAAVGPAGICTAPTNNSYVPYADLGIRGATINGVLNDVWLQPVRYRVTSVSPAIPWFYASNTIGLSGNPLPNLRVCSILPCPASPSANILATNLIAVIFSTGDPLSTAASVNINAVNDFLSAEPSTAFDDTVVWIAQPELVYALSKAR
jgi:prepilin-type N-terminal cleavage/methylation domain-containing protein